MAVKGMSKSGFCEHGPKKSHIHCVKEGCDCDCHKTTKKKVTEDVVS